MSVLVVGAGLSGLSTAMFLGMHGVAPLVVERRPGTSMHPKARGQFPHTMEVLRLAGVDQQVIDAAPADPDFRIIVAGTAAGPVFHEVQAADGPDLTALSPAGWANTSQERVEPILAARAREFGAEIRFRTELDHFSQDPVGVTAVLRDLTSGERTTRRFDYLVAADGHRSPVRQALGIGRHGRGVLGEGVSALFEADLPITGNVLIYLRNGQLPGGGGVIVSTDEPGRYALAVGVVDAPDWEHLVRVAAGDPDLAVRIVDGGQDGTQTAHFVADRFSSGRVHLVGDAVRVMPPTGAFGGNTAILDGFYPAWKLAMVVRGDAGPGLLGSHDPERRPYSELIAEQQYTQYVQRLSPNLADDTVAPVVEPISTLFFGYRHISDAVVLEPGDVGETLENPESATGRPGSRAPHVPVTVDGRLVSTIDLFGRGFVLLTGSRHWVDRAAELELTAYLIEEPRWAKAYGVTMEGAVLVRPDFFVAWRTQDSEGDLAGVTRTILDLS